MAEEPNEEQQEKAYQFNDKRRVNEDGTLREEADKEQEKASDQETAQGEEQEQPEMPPPNIYNELQFMAWALSQLAWQLMGLQLAPGSKEPIKDMAQAKLAIDTVAFLADKLHPHIGEEERKMLRGIVSDLQMNYVRQS